MTIFSIIILWGIVTVITGDELTRIYIGSDLRFEPGQGKNMGFLEIHWGGKNENNYYALALGFASKTLLSSIQLKNPDAVKMLDNLVQSDTEFFIGIVQNKTLYHLKNPSKEYKVAATTVAGLPDIPPGSCGLGERIEVILNFPNKKTEKDPYVYGVCGAYLNYFHATEHLVVCPMIGIGTNMGLDYHFVEEEGSKAGENPFKFLRWKIRLDIATRKIIKIGEMNFHFFLVAQHERPGWPWKTTGLLQLEDGTFARTRLLRESSIRVGIMIDLFPSPNGE